MKKWNLNFFN